MSARLLAELAGGVRAADRGRRRRPARPARREALVAFAERFAVPVVASWRRPDVHAERTSVLYRHDRAWPRPPTVRRALRRRRPRGGPRDTPQPDDDLRVRPAGGGHAPHPGGRVAPGFAGDRRPAGRGGHGRRARASWRPRWPCPTPPLPDAAAPRRSPGRDRRGSRRLPRRHDAPRAAARDGRRAGGSGRRRAGPRRGPARATPS